MKYTKLAVILALLLILIPSVLSVKFTATITPDEKSIKTTETAEYTISIVHDGDDSISFELFSPDVFWDVRTEKSLLVPKGERGLTTKLFISSLYLWEPQITTLFINYNMNPVTTNGINQWTVRGK